MDGWDGLDGYGMEISVWALSFGFHLNFLGKKDHLIALTKAWFSGEFESQRTYCAKYDRLAGGDEVFCDQLHYAPSVHEDEEEEVFTLNLFFLFFYFFFCFFLLAINLCLNIWEVGRLYEIEIPYYFLAI